MNKEFEKAYLFTGVNGVGKTTLLRSICEKDPDRFDLFPGSTRLMERLGLKPKDYGSLRQLPEDYKVKEFNTLMIDTLRQKHVGKKVVLLIDAHLYNYKRGEMIETLGQWVEYIDSIFLITTDASSLQRRISLDRKARDILPDGLGEGDQLKALVYYLETTEKKAREISRQFGIPFYVIPNPENGTQEALSRFFDIHERYLTKRINHNL